MYSLAKAHPHELAQPADCSLSSRLIFVASDGRKGGFGCPMALRDRLCRANHGFFVLAETRQLMADSFATGN
jgi:hypothetical protein